MKISPNQKIGFGIFLIILGVIFSFSLSFFGGLFIVISGLLLLPQIIKIIEKKLGEPIPKTVRRTVIITCYFIGWLLAFKSPTNIKDETNNINKDGLIEYRDSSIQKNSLKDSLNAEAHSKRIKDSQTSIVVTSIIVKKIDGKFKYWFDIRNKGKKTFDGIVKIWCISYDESFKIDESFKTSKPLEPNLGEPEFIELRTGTTEFAGANGVSKFMFEVFIDGEKVEEGKGNITNNFENLDE